MFMKYKFTKGDNSGYLKDVLRDRSWKSNGFELCNDYGKWHMLNV